MVLDEPVWVARQRAHEARVDAWIQPRINRQSAGRKHPVYDFLFEYYSHRPSQLRRWHPGTGVFLKGTGIALEEFLSRPGYRGFADGCVGVDPFSWKPARRDFVVWLAKMLEASALRPGWFGCAGLHEWAMVYQAGPQRHHDWPLRLGQVGTDAVVQSLPIRCSHFDAFRFFTPEARPLNRIQPERATIPEVEQPGCLHANMDLYKWAYKLTPFTRSELIADAFALATEIREVDMRASPYDFSALGFEPIAIESAGGRAEFEGYQRAFSARAVPLRDELLRVSCALLDLWQAEGSGLG